MADSEISGEVNTVDFEEAMERLESRLNSVRRLLLEIRAFEQSVEFSMPLHARLQHPKQPLISLQSFRTAIEAEKKSLERLTRTLPSDLGGPQDNMRDIWAATKLGQNSNSNSYYFITVWSIALQCHGVKGIFDNIMWKDGPAVVSWDRKSVGHKPQKRKPSIRVDIVTENGDQWIKVSTTTEKKILFEITKEGLGLEDFGSSESDGERSDSCSLNSGMENDYKRLPLFRQVHELKRAAQDMWFNYSHPSVRLILSRITEGKNKLIDLVLSDLRRSGIIVECLGSSHTPSLARNSTVDATSSFRTMAPAAHHPPLTSTLNLDIGVLLCLVSDISHSAPSALSPRVFAGISTRKDDLFKQIEIENLTPILPTELYPLLVEKSLIITTEAATQARKIVNTVGTMEERKRCDLLLASYDQTIGGDEAQHRRIAFQDTSIHPMPSELRLPIRTHPTSREHLPAAANELELELSELNASIFFHGWAQNITTVTGNQHNARDLARSVWIWVEKHGVEQIQGPKVWVVANRRMLLGNRN